MTIKEIQTTINQANALKQIASAYTEISSNKIKRIRNLVEKNRNFLDELSAVYKVLKKRAETKNLLPKKNGKTISLLLSANEHFSGSINQDLTKYFVDKVRSQTHSASQGSSKEGSGQADQVVIGKTAVEWLDSIKYQNPYTKIILKKGYPESSELDVLVRLVKDYSQIIVYYPRMKTVLLQIPTSEDITQTAYLSEMKVSEEDAKKLFIFEPEFTKILEYFESQVTNLLLQQAFLEGELSRTAARLVSMDESQSNADKVIKQNAIILDHAKKQTANGRLLETYASIILTKNTNLNYES